MSYNFPDSPTNGQEFTPVNGPTYIYKPPVWVVKPGESSGGGGIPEAPMDSNAYGRRDATWTNVLMASNDVVDGGNF